MTQLLTCTRLLARLTQQGCDGNRARKNPACETCSGLERKFTLDFAGYEDVWEELHKVSTDPNHDILCLLDAALSGAIPWRRQPQEVRK